MFLAHNQRYGVPAVSTGSRTWLLLRATTKINSTKTVKVAAEYDEEFPNEDLNTTLISVNY